MESSDAEWHGYLAALESQRAEVEAWPVTDPDLSAIRCEQSLHRTLGHLRAAQETWLQAASLFAVKDMASITLLHPWRLFEREGYESVPWDQHLAAFVADRLSWIELVNRSGLDRSRGGKMSRKDQTIESLTGRLVNHERCHIDLVETKLRMR